MNWYFALIHYMGALFCFWLCRDLGRGRAASILAGIGFGLSGYCGNVDWPQMLNGAIWIPLIVLYCFRSFRGRRPVASAALAGTFLGISFLSGHHQIPTFTAFFASGPISRSDRTAATRTRS